MLCDVCFLIRAIVFYRVALNDACASSVYIVLLMGNFWHCDWDLDSCSRADFSSLPNFAQMLTSAKI